MGGFECSTHRNRSGRRLDLVAATSHDEFVFADYARLTGLGLRTVREGLRWHLIEPAPGRYDFSSVLPILLAAREHGVQVIWDLCHYGWPDDLDIFSPEFIDRFARLTRAFARLLRTETHDVPFIAPVNEISFFSWACAEVGVFYPYEQARGDELKAQLVRAAIEGTEAFWSVEPRARVVHIDPLINVVSRPEKPEDRDAAESYRLAQYEGWDMVGGRLCPELGGAPKYLDIIGVNYYPHNQWLYPERTMIQRSHELYRPFREMLAEISARYDRPLFVAETGIEDDERPGWLRYVGGEVRAALEAGTPVQGVCLYPILNHPGWEDDRHCRNGLYDYADENGKREIYAPLADELRRQIASVEQFRRTSHTSFERFAAA